MSLEEAASVSISIEFVEGSPLSGVDASTSVEDRSPFTDSSANRIASLFGCFCFSFFLEGWNDGSTGPLLPTIQAFYGLNYAVVSMVFILNAVGFILGAATLVLLVERFGMGKVCIYGSCVHKHLTDCRIFR